MVEVYEVCLNWKDKVGLGFRQRSSFILYDFHYTAFHITFILISMSDTASQSTCVSFNVKIRLSSKNPDPNTYLVVFEHPPFETHFYYTAKGQTFLVSVCVPVCVCVCVCMCGDMHESVLILTPSYLWLMRMLLWQKEETIFNLRSLLLNQYISDYR